MRHDRDPGVREQAPGLVEQRVIRVEVADLQMALEYPRARLERAGDIGRGVGLGEERRGLQAAGRAGREVRRPLVKRAGHAWLVRVEHGRERPHAERPQRRHPVPLAVPVGDGPGPADQRPGRVEVRPDRGHQPFGHEVRVHVNDGVKPGPRAEGRDPCGLVGLGSHQHLNLRVMFWA